MINFTALRVAINHTDTCPTQFQIYLAKPDSYPSNPSKLLLLLTGGTGLKSANNQIQADKFAAEGYVVVMPDLFEGDPAPNGSHTTVPEHSGPAESGSPSFLDTFKLKAVETAKSFLIDMWLARHAEEKVWPILEKVIHAAEGEFADAVGNGGGIYAVGYCFGARYVLLLAGERDAAAENTGWTGARKPADEEQAEPTKPEKKGPYIKAGALAHATLVSPDDFQGLRVPVSLVCVENDPMFPDEVRTAGEDVMSKNNLEHEVQVYPGVPHGKSRIPFPPFSQLPLYLSPLNMVVGTREIKREALANATLIQYYRLWRHRRLR